MEKTRHAGIETKLPTAKARTSDKLARVIEGPTSTRALLIRSSNGELNGCLFTACTKIHILSTPTWIISYLIGESKEDICLEYQISRKKGTRERCLTPHATPPSPYSPSLPPSLCLSMRVCVCLVILYFLSQTTKL